MNADSLFSMSVRVGNMNACAVFFMFMSCVWLCFLHMCANPSLSSHLRYPYFFIYLSILNPLSLPVHSQLTLDDFSLFRQIEATEYVDDLFELKSRYGTPGLRQFAELVNREMFWVITAVCGEQNLVKRMKIVKQFIKVARE